MEHGGLQMVSFVQENKARLPAASSAAFSGQPIAPNSVNIRFQLLRLIAPDNGALFPARADVQMAYKAWAERSALRFLSLVFSWFADV